LQGEVQDILAALREGIFVDASSAPAEVLPELESITKRLSLLIVR